MDLTNTPKIQTVLQQGAYNFGLDIEDLITEKTAETRNYVDQKYALLAQEDERVNGVMNNLLKIADAQPGTPEWDEGQNLYTLISQNYVGLLTRIETNEGDITQLKAFAAQTTQDIATWMTQVNTRIDQEILRAEGAEQEIRAELQQAKSDLNDKTDLTNEAVTALTGRVGTLETKMATRVQEIGALQTKQQENTSEISVLKSLFDSLSVVPIVNEFRRGLRKQASAFGYDRVPVA